MRMLRIRLLAAKEVVLSAARKSSEARAAGGAMQASAITHEVRKLDDELFDHDREQLVDLASQICLSADLFSSILDAFAALKIKN